MASNQCLLLLLQVGLVSAAVFKSKQSLRASRWGSTRLNSTRLNSTLQASKLAPLDLEKELDTEVKAWCEKTWANNAKWTTFTEERFGEAEKLSGDFGMELSGIKDMIAAKTMEFLNDPIKQLEYTQSKAAQEINFQQIKLKEQFANARAVRYNWLIALQSIRSIDEVVTKVCNEHKNFTEKLQKEYADAKFLQVTATSKASRSRSTSKRPFDYVEHTDSSCSGTSGDLLTDFQAKTPDLCKDKCDEFGMDCGGFVFIISGYHKETCLIRKGAVQNIAIYADDDRSCFEKEKPDGAKAAMKALEGRKKRIGIMKKYCEYLSKNRETAKALKDKIKGRRKETTAKFEADIKVIEARQAKFNDVCKSSADDAKAFAEIATKEKDSYGQMVESLSKEQAALLDSSHQQWMSWREALANIYDLDKQKCDGRKLRNQMRVLSRQEQIDGTNLEASPLQSEAANSEPPDVCPSDTADFDKELKDIEDKIKDVTSWSE